MLISFTPRSKFQHLRKTMAGTHLIADIVASRAEGRLVAAMESLATWPHSLGWGIVVAGRWPHFHHVGQGVADSSEGWILMSLSLKLHGHWDLVPLVFCGFHFFWICYSQLEEASCNWPGRSEARLQLEAKAARQAERWWLWVTVRAFWG